MNTDKLKELISNSELIRIQKNALHGFVERARVNQEKKNTDLQLLEKFTSGKFVEEILISTQELIVYKLSPSKDEWDTKYPYRSIFLNEKGEWERCNTVSPSLDTTLLTYLQYKYLGANSDFADFAIKILEIKIEQ